MSEIMANTF